MMVLPHALLVFGGHDIGDDDVYTFSIGKASKVVNTWERALTSRTIPRSYRGTQSLPWGRFDDTPN